MPAEWEPHEATWLAWPHEKSDWPGKFAPIPWLYGEIVRHLSRVERVRILVENADAERTGPAHFEESATPMLDAVEFFHHAHQSQLDARLLPDFRQEPRGSRHYTLAIQRLGEILELRA